MNKKFLTQDNFLSTGIYLLALGKLVTEEGMELWNRCFRVQHLTVEIYASVF